MSNVKKRNGFSSGIGFILATAGSAIGLGNLWSFPYKTAKYGGAAYVFMYIIFVILIGTTVMIAELYIGKRAQANPVSAYKKVNKKVGWIGLFAVVIPFIIVCYYSILGGYTVKFALNSFSGNSNIVNSFAGNVGEVILFTAIFVVLAVVIVMSGIKGGIEKASKVLMPILFLILIAIAIYSLCLGEGVMQGLDFYLNPKFSQLGFEGVLASMSQAFFSLSLGMGIIASYGSYAGKEIKVGKSVTMVCIFDTLVALLAGLAIFPAVYHYQAINGGSNLRLDGVLLMFQTLPLVFESMGAFGSIVSLFFFSMIVIAALTSVISLFEVVTQFVIQKFKVHRKKAILIVSAITFLISIPIGISLGFAMNGQNKLILCQENLLDFFDLVTNNILMPLGALGACITIGWLLEKPKKARQRFSPMNLYRTLKEDGLDIGFFGKIFIAPVKRL